MSIKLTVLSPAYFPSVSVLRQIALADVAVWADTFLYKKHDMMNRTRIKTVAGAQWLTIPVLTKGLDQQAIDNVEIDSQHPWARTHLKSLKVNYQNSPYYFFLADDIKDLLSQPWRLLNDLLLETLLFLCQKMRLKTEIRRAQELPTVADRSQRVVEWARATGCDVYLLNQAEAHLIDRESIEKRGCAVNAMDFQPPVYHQLFGEFLAELSGLDLLFNEGELSKSILRKATGR